MCMYVCMYVGMPIYIHTYRHAYIHVRVNVMFERVFTTSQYRFYCSENLCICSWSVLCELISFRIYNIHHLIKLNKFIISAGFLSRANILSKI